MSNFLSYQTWDAIGNFGHGGGNFAKCWVVLEAKYFVFEEKRNTTSVLTIFVSSKLDSIIAFVIVVKTYGSCFWFLGIENKTTSVKFLADFLGKWPNFPFLAPAVTAKFMNEKQRDGFSSFPRNSVHAEINRMRNFIIIGNHIVFLIR